MNILRRLLLAISISLPLAAAAAAPADTTLWRYVPKFGGTLRTFYSFSTATGDSRFYVANARLDAGGYIMPWLDYYIQVDFCAQGKVTILDAYATVRPVEGLKLMIGQMRVPFCVEATRAPYTYYFANTALNTDFGNLRSVGVKAGYTLPCCPLYFEGGAFNSASMTDHSQWSRALTYSIKTNYKAACGLTPEVGFMSRVPGGNAGVRVNMLDASLSWRCGRFFVEGEYTYRHYTGSRHKASHAYDVFADYGIPLKARMADKISFQARYDGITDASDGHTFIDDGSGKLATTIAGHRRVTVGTTVSKQIGPLFTAFRINFEQYFYSRGAEGISPADNNQLIAGLIVHF